MVIVNITASGPDAPKFLVAAPSMKALYAALRGLPFARIDVHGTFTHPGPSGLDFILPEDETKLTARLLAESDKGTDAPLALGRAFMLAPAYGRTYRTTEEAAADWTAGKDFVITSLGTDFGRYCSIRDTGPIREEGYTHVSIALVASPFAHMVALEQAK
jgi:hypothetical protein